MLKKILQKNEEPEATFPSITLGIQMGIFVFVIFNVGKVSERKTK